jgi:hypothetical protein
VASRGRSKTSSETLTGCFSAMRTKRVLAIELRTGKVSTLATAKGMVRAIATDEAVLAMLIEREGSEGKWEVARTSRAGGEIETVGTFERAPYHRHALVLARGKACTTAGDRVLAVGVV